jgi:ribonuclease HI
MGKKNVEIYTDGACSGNPGPGGWGAILMYKGHERELSGYEAMTTNNRMELTAVIMALRALKEPCSVTIYTDSAYVVNAFTKGWVTSWLQNGWRTAGKTPVENQDLWERLLELCQTHRVTWKKVKGHADNELNNLCDQLARLAIKNRGEEGPAAN